MKNLRQLVFAMVLSVACFIPAPASAYYYRDGITDIITEVTTFDTTTVATIIDTALGLPVPVGIIAIGKRRHQRSHL